jgi:hypothetical protein
MESSLANAVMNLEFTHKMREFLDQLIGYQFLKKDSIPWG